MQGKVIAAGGVALVVLGAFGLYFAYENASAGAAALAWAAIILGALAMLAGIARFMSGFMASQHAPEVEQGPTEVRLLIQCMGAVAAADGAIRPEEMRTIARIHERVLGIAVDENEVAEILGEFDASFDVAGALQSHRPQLSRAMRERIVKSCYLVMMSDLDEDRAETGKVHEIGAALGFTREQVDDLAAMAGV